MDQPNAARDVGAEDDKSLIVAAQTGSDRALALVYARYVRQVERTCRRYLRDPHEIEDAVQDTFVRAFRALPRFNGRYLVGAWLTTIARNVCWDIGRRKSRAIPSVSLNAIAFDVVGPEQVNPFLDPDGRVADVLGSLQPRYAIPLQLASIHGMSHREIATILDKSPHQVKALLFRARRAFERRWRATQPSADERIHVSGDVW